MELIQMESNRVRRYRDARLDVDFHTQAVLLDGATVRLTPMEFALLAELARNAGEIVSRDTLMSNVWGDRKSTRLNSSHLGISYAVFCLKKKKKTYMRTHRQLYASGKLRSAVS